MHPQVSGRDRFKVRVARTVAWLMILASVSLLITGPIVYGFDPSMLLGRFIGAVIVALLAVSFLRGSWWAWSLLAYGYLVKALLSLVALKESQWQLTGNRAQILSAVLGFVIFGLILWLWPTRKLLRSPRTS